MAEESFRAVLLESPGHHLLRASSSFRLPIARLRSHALRAAWLRARSPPDLTRRHSEPPGSWQLAGALGKFQRGASARATPLRATARWPPPPPQPRSRNWLLHSRRVLPGG